MDTMDTPETSNVSPLRGGRDSDPTDTEILRLYEMQYRDSHLAALWAVYDLGRDDAAKELRNG